MLDEALYKELIDYQEIVHIVKFSKSLDNKLKYKENDKTVKNKV